MLCLCVLFMIKSFVEITVTWLIQKFTIPKKMYFEGDRKFDQLGKMCCWRKKRHDSQAKSVLPK